jgi:YjbE family integral membrane protein
VDFGFFGSITFDWDFLTRLTSIVIIDLILAGDNAVIIAMAVRALPRDKRKAGIIFGSGAAVLLRVACTFFVAQMLQISFLKFVGGIVILWIAVKLFIEAANEREIGKEAKSIWQAIKIIIIADITMSVDNMLAVGAASHGNMFLLLFGLGLSIPFLVFTSNLLSMLMDKYPIIMYLGAAVLGKVGAEMMITDPVVDGILAPSAYMIYALEAAFAVGVIVVGKLLIRRRQREKEHLLSSSDAVASPDAPENE